jgi:hypothetical protein
MGTTNVAKNAAVDAVNALGDWISLHTDDPGTTGANEDTSVPREQTVWGLAVAGESIGTQVAFDAQGLVHYTHYGVHDADTGGTFIRGEPLDPGFTLDADGIARGIPRYTFPGA